MIYLSAQPDKYYFLWQLHLQLFNFSSLEIPREQIHVLIGFDPKKGLHPHFQPFVESNPHAQVFVYPDWRGRQRMHSPMLPAIDIPSEMIRYLSTTIEPEILRSLFPMLPDPRIALFLLINS